MQFVKANEVDFNCSTSTRYNRGQVGRKKENGKLYALRGFRTDTGANVWVEISVDAVKPKGKVLETRPADTFNPHGVMTARAKGKNPRTSQPNSVAVAIERVEARNSHSTLRQRNAIRHDGIQAFAHI